MSWDVDRDVVVGDSVEQDGSGIEGESSGCRWMFGMEILYRLRRMRDIGFRFPVQSTRAG